MKNALFMELVGPHYLPQAKLASMLFLLVTLVLYGKGVDWLGKRRLLGVLYTLYALLFAVMTYFFQQGAQNHHLTLGWGFYLSIESFGSLGISHLWSLAVNATTDPAVAARRFPMLAVGGQIGACTCTFLLARSAGQGHTLVPLLYLAVVLIAVAPMLTFQWLQSNHIEDVVQAQPEAKKETGLWEGLRLVMTRPYLAAILWSVVAYELVGTYLDYQMNSKAHETLVSLERVTAFLATYGFAANLLSFIFALTGTSWLVRRWGLSRCLIIYPALLCLVVLGAASFPTLGVFFACQIALKGAAYGFNKPCLELVYVPTSDDIQFKAKSWIDTAGSRGGKALGSLMNAHLLRYAPAWLVWGGASVCLVFLAIWMPVSRALGDRYEQLLADNEKLS
jgi:AAA family ATP:ADP antiporter